MAGRYRPRRLLGQGGMGAVWLAADGPLPVDRAASIGLRLVDALQATHRAGIVHRDVKPSNLQPCGGVRAVLTDFGIASATDDRPGGSTCEIVGSPAYTSPERVHGADLGPASDVFSLGATLYAAVEGRSPFGKSCPVATLTAVVTDPPAPLLRAGPRSPVIEGLLAKEPGRRLGPDQARGALRAIQCHGEASPPRGAPSTTGGASDSSGQVRSRWRAGRRPRAGSTRSSTEGEVR